MNGFHIKPNNKTSDGIIVTFGGSEGGCNYFQAIELGQKGYEVIALYFFGQNNQPKTLNKIPLEFFNELLLYTQVNNIDTNTLTLLGGSKGAELSLLLTNFYKEIDNVILYAPSSYVFQGLDFTNSGSSWTWNSQELPYISFSNSSPWALLSMFNAMIFNYPVSYLQQYQTAIKNSKNTKDALIDIADFKGKILIFAGDNDSMWPSAIMAQKIHEMNTENVEFIIYENAGHLFQPVTYIDRVALGGTKEKNESAKQDSDIKLFNFLNIHHQKNSKGGKL